MNMLDALILVWAVILLPIVCVSIYDWYKDFFVGLNKIEVVYKDDGRKEEFMYSSKERRMFIRTMKRYRVKAEVK